MVSASPTWKPHVGVAVGREVLEPRLHHVHKRLQRLERIGRGAPAGEHRDTELGREATVADLAPALELFVRGRGTRGHALGDERAAAAAADGVQVPALDQGGERLTQGGAGDPELGAQVALGRQARARLEEAEPDGRAEPLERLLERRLRAHRREDRIRGERRPRLHGAQRYRQRTFAANEVLTRLSRAV